MPSPGMQANATGADTLDALARELEESGDFKVLRRFVPRDTYHPDDGADKKLAMVVDTETTGKDFQKDRVFEIGFVIAEYDPDSGRFYRVVDRYSGLDDPGFPLPEKIEQLTGVKYADVEGKSFDDIRIREAIARVDVVVAQNAGFDRKFLEPIFPEFAAKPWACSHENGPWEEMAISTRKQEFLAFKVCGVFYEAHRALTDAEVLLDILASPAHDGRLIMGHVLDRARSPSFRVWAVNSPFDTKDSLKDNGYRWSDGNEPGKPKAWYKDAVIDIEPELAFLAGSIYPRSQKILVDELTALDRFSTRAGDRKEVNVDPARQAAKPRP